MVQGVETRKKAENNQKFKLKESNSPGNNPDKTNKTDETQDHTDRQALNKFPIIGLSTIWQTECDPLFRTWRQGRTQTIAFEGYQWSDGLLGTKVGSKRVETQYLVRFERHSFQETDNGFRC